MDGVIARSGRRFEILSSGSTSSLRVRCPNVRPRRPRVSAEFRLQRVVGTSVIIEGGTTPRVKVICIALSTYTTDRCLPSDARFLRW